MPGSHYAALFIAIGVGLVGLLLSINRLLPGFVAMIAYIPVAYFVLIIYMLAFACFVLGNCI